MLDHFLDPFGALFTPEVAERVAAFRVDAATQARIDALADKCTEGQLTAAEGEEYDTYLMAIDFITVLQAKARTVLDHRLLRMNTDDRQQVRAALRARGEGTS